MLLPLIAGRREIHVTVALNVLTMWHSAAKVWTMLGKVQALVFRAT